MKLLPILLGVGAGVGVALVSPIAAIGGGIATAIMSKAYRGAGVAAAIAAAGAATAAAASSGPQ